jgi:hypothetical protein
MTSDAYPVQWTGRQAIVALPEASPWSKSTSALDDTDGPAAPAADAAVSGIAAKLSNETTAPNGIRRRIWHPFRNPPHGGSNHAHLPAAIQDPALTGTTGTARSHLESQATHDATGRQRSTHGAGSSRPCRIPI